MCKTNTNIAKKILIIIFSVIVLSFNCVYAIGPGENIKKNIAVVGDSSMEFFKTFVKMDDFDYYQFPEDGITRDENVAIFTNCINSDTNKYILFCEGFSDYLQMISQSTFENYLRLYATLALEKNKVLFFYTYMDFYRAELREDGHTVKELDDVYRKLANEFPNVFYIDMTNLNNDEYAFGDGYNYGEAFFVTLASRVIYLSEEMESTTTTTIFPWSATTDSSKIAVVGDSFAHNFITYEKDRYTLLDFSKEDTKLLDNYDSFVAAMSSDAKTVLISLGVKDFEERVEAIDFEKMLRTYLSLACLRHKKVILHTYMHFIGELGGKRPKVVEYDNAIRKLAAEYPNATYIDMSEYAVPEYQENEKYYSKKFYDKLYELLKV